MISPVPKDLPYINDNGGDREIIRASAGEDLLVMGTNGRTGFEYLRLGSVAEKTVRHARCPVLVVRAPETMLPKI